MKAPKGKLGQQVRRLREALGLTQGAFGKLVGTGRQTVSHVERGRRTLGPGCRAKWGAILGEELK